MSTPVIRLSDSARRALQDAAVGAGGDPLRIRISDRWEYDLFFGLRAEGDLDVDCDGITILLDPSSARRADGLSIDFLVGPDAAGFTIENPNEPPKVKQISAAYAASPRRSIFCARRVSGICTTCRAESTPGPSSWIRPCSATEILPEPTGECALRTP